MPDSDPKRLNQDEQRFLEAYDPNHFERPSVAIDLVILTVQDKLLKALMVKRADFPFKDDWCLLGGFVGLEESLDTAATRVLWQKGGLANVFLEQLYAFGDPARDPRMRIISVAYYALAEADQLKLASPAVALLPVSVAWTGTIGGPASVQDASGQPCALAFDHSLILGTAVQRIRRKLAYEPIGFEFLPGMFTLRQLQEVHEAILGQKLNKDSFRRKMLAQNCLEATDTYEQNTDYRPAELYRFKGV